MDTIDSDVGLSNQEALRVLAEKIEIELKNFKKKHSNLKIIFSNFILNNLVYLIHNLLILLVSIFLLIFSDNGYLSGTFLLIVSILNFAALFLIFYKKKFAVYQKLNEILKNLRDHVSISDNWTEASFFPNSISHSPSISTQLAIRSGKLVNLPLNLIVENDLILIRPGQMINLTCKSLFYQNSLKDEKIFKVGDRYEQIKQEDDLKHKLSSKYPRMIKSPEPIKCIALETPYVSYLRKTLETYKCNTDSLLANEMKHFLKIIVFIIIPIVCLVQTFVYSFYSSIIIRQKSIKFHILIQSFVYSSAYSILPLLPLSLFLFFHLIKLYGSLSLIKTFKKFKTIKENYQKLLESNNDDDEDKNENRLLINSNSTDNFDAYLENIVNSSSLETNPTESINSYIDVKSPKNSIKSQLKEIFYLIKAIFYGKTNNFNDENIQFIYNTNFFIGLGTLTNFSCADKQGVLSWPNPSADTIWVFKNQDETKDDNSIHEFSETDGEKYQQSQKELKLESFNLSHSKIDPHKLEFDDAKLNYIKNSNLLKPLGLSILLNNCNKHLYEDFSKLNDLKQIKSVDTNIENRFCLCEISRLLNFQSNASDCYEMISSNSLIRQNQEDSQKAQISSLLSFIANYKYNGMLNLYAQGSSDLIIDFCSHYWDGKQIEKLKMSQRKKIIDLYNRHSVTSICCAFAYKPLVDYEFNINKNFHTIECPPECCDVWNTCDDISQASTNAYETRSFDFDATEKDEDKININENKHDEELFELHFEQIFIGMVSMQYHAKLEVIRLIEKLTKACIRFVHFSYDNEQISRVFGQLLGLDTGWNCHISLKDDPHDQITNEQEKPKAKKVDKCSNNSLLSQFNKLIYDTSLKRSLPNLKNSQITYDSQTQTVKFNLNNVDRRVEMPKQNEKIKQDDESSHRTIHSGRTLSDNELLGNAARLPKGISNIRSHLENVDNVPLHVSLFTDCTKDSIKEMFNILQDYGEIVCCLGSSLSNKNMELFSGANLSISIDPLYPQQCIKDKIDIETSENKSLNPIDISSSLNTISCGFSLQNDNISLLPYVLSTAHELVHSIRICLLFMIMCNLSLSLMNILTSFLFIPPVLSDYQLLSLVIFVIPFLSFSLINKKDGENSLRFSTNKNTHTMDKDRITTFLIQYFFKFCPTVCILVIVHWLLLFFNCRSQNKDEKCSIMISTIFYQDKTNDEFISNPWNVSTFVQISQIINYFFMVIYCILLSTNYVCVEKSLWSYIPFKNKVWTATVITIFLLSLFHVSIDILSFSDPKALLQTIPFIAWIILAVIWPLIMVSINELIKVFEIKETVRKYKKLRLEFDTKLGMNSPFV